MYYKDMPRLWSETIETHRQEVRDAILDTTAALAAEHGPLSVTMSQVAGETGIGRATLYKYFPDVESILAAWHHRQVRTHLEQLAAIRDRETDPIERLDAVLETFASIQYDVRVAHSSDTATHLHRSEHVAQARQELLALVRDLIAQAAAVGGVRGDVSPDELARYALHALGAAGGLPSKSAVRRLVHVTLAGLRPD